MIPKEGNMSILIKGMEMPEAGEHVLLLQVYHDGTASVIGDHRHYKHEPFETVLVPSHGDLVERDELIKTIRTERNRIAKACGDDDDFVRCLDKYALSMAVCAPTIIPADTEGEM